MISGSSFFAGDENSNNDVAAFMNLIKSLIPEVNDGCSVWINHHVSKGRENEGGSAMGRGASAARDALRVVFNFTQLTPKEIETAGISNSELYTKLELSKSNWTPSANIKIYLKRDTGSTGGVLRQVDLEARRQEAEAHMNQIIPETLANLISEHEEEFTVKQLVNQPKGKPIRDALKEKHGKNWVTQKSMPGYIEEARRRGLITVEETSKRGQVCEIVKAA